MAALDQRCEDAKISTRSRSCEDVLVAFGEAVKSSKAVINKKELGVVLSLAKSDNELYALFYKAVDAGSRLPEDNVYDGSRGAIDSTVFPYYHNEMCFAALSLDGRGVEKFGSYAMVLKEDIIKHRANVFEENSWKFIRRHRIVPGDPMPPGYRAVWDRRHDLAKAKLHSELTVSTKTKDFAGILLKQNIDDSGFIEVHIYGSFTRRGLERVRGPQPKKSSDRVLWRSLEKTLKTIGVTLDTD